MDYMSTQEAADKWKISMRQVQRLLHEERIPGAKKYGNYWMIPSTEKKPEDLRKAQNNQTPESGIYTLHSTIALPKNASEFSLASINEEFQPLVQAEMEYRCGNPEPAKALWYKTDQGSQTKLSVASLATATAISSGDYYLYNEIKSFLYQRSSETENETDKTLLLLPVTSATVSMVVPALTPDWLKNCDFSLLPYELRPFLLYLYALHLRNVGDYSAMLATAKATLVLCEKSSTFTWLDIYLNVLCAVASYVMGDTVQSKNYLDTALAIAMPYGFITPFADYLGELGGILGTSLESEYPKHAQPVVDLWSNSFKNWMNFHNEFANDNITTILSPQEYQVAHFIVHGATYKSAAENMNLSVSRIKKILTGVYSKLYIQSKQELSDFIL